jgi:hypothetical protein
MKRWTAIERNRTIALEEARWRNPENLPCSDRLGEILTPQPVSSADPHRLIRNHDLRIHDGGCRRSRRVAVSARVPSRETARRRAQCGSCGCRWRRRRREAALDRGARHSGANARSAAFTRRPESVRRPPRRRRQRPGVRVEPTLAGGSDSRGRHSRARVWSSPWPHRMLPGRRRLRLADDAPVGRILSSWTAADHGARPSYAVGRGAGPGNLRRHPDSLATIAGSPSASCLAATSSGRRPSASSSNSFARMNRWRSVSRRLIGRRCWSRVWAWSSW